ncbi:MAG: DUF5050 domain-containing protein [Clostridia bacterium]|nr:DUF5050 domain-containing protein [Clostridia bacterium]
MKKLIMLLIVTSLTLSLLSCSQTPPTDGTPTPTTTGSQTTTDGATNETTHGITETTTEGKAPEKPTVTNAYYPISDAFSETPTRLLYVQTGVIRYYNKLTGEENIFCFDPLCKHKDHTTCIAHKFGMADSGIQSIEYCAYNNRFYALRGAQFCSFAFDGSDLKVEASFGEAGKFGSDKHGVYPYGGTVYLGVQGKYVYFMANQSESGKKALMCFDVESGKLSTLYHREDTHVLGYQVSENALYYNLSGEESGIYCAAPDGSNPRKISDEVFDLFHEGIFDGEKVYFLQVNDQDQHCIFSYTPGMDLFEEVTAFTTKTATRLLAVTEDAVYFTRSEPVLVGHTEGRFGTFDVTNDWSKIYRLDKSTGETVTVLDDITCETRMIHFTDDNGVIIVGGIYFPDEKKANSNDACFTAKLDENGMFTELTPLT